MTSPIHPSAAHRVRYRSGNVALPLTLSRQQDRPHGRRDGWYGRYNHTFTQYIGRILKSPCMGTILSGSWEDSRGRSESIILHLSCPRIPLSLAAGGLVAARATSGPRRASERWSEPVGQMGPAHEMPAAGGGRGRPECVLAGCRHCREINAREWVGR